MKSGWLLYCNKLKGKIMSNVNKNDFIDEEDKAEFHALTENLGLTERQEAGVWGWICP